jgi:hypothetical protein
MCPGVTVGVAPAPVVWSYHFSVTGNTVTLSALQAMKKDVDFF